VALWREALLAQAVLLGRTVGYRHHPQLRRFQATDAPAAYLAAYLRAVHAEAVRRGYRFDEARIGPEASLPPLTVTTGQLAYEWHHLQKKLEARAPAWLEQEAGLQPEPHPLFTVVAGAVAPWEIHPA